jgi:hypothetical protein
MCETIIHCSLANGGQKDLKVTSDISDLNCEVYQKFSATNDILCVTINLLKQVFE